ncbi:MAG: PaaI family thioesterase [Flavonifractor plautii]
MADEAQLDAIARANAFAVYNGITTHQTGDGTAEAILEIGPDSLNPYGLLHGGAYYTLADCAAGSACRTDGRKYVTLHGSLDFIRSARAGQVTARARVEHRGRTTCLVSITVDDGAGTVCQRPLHLFLHRPPLSRGRPPGRQTLSGRFCSCYCPAKRPPTRSANGRPATWRCPEASPPPGAALLLRLGLQRPPAQAGPPAVRRGGEYRPGVQAAANVVAGHQVVHIGVVGAASPPPHAQQHPDRWKCRCHTFHRAAARSTASTAIPIGQRPLKGQP